MATHQAPPSLGFSRKEHWVGCHFLLQCMKVKSESEVAQLCLTLRDPMDYSLPGSSIHGIFQARVLEWVAIAFSKYPTLLYAFLHWLRDLSDCWQSIFYRQPCCCCCCCCCVTSVVSNSVWPHRWQPTRLRCPWDSPGKNTGVGCHFLLQRMKVKNEREVVQSCPTLSDHMDCSLPGSSVHGIFQARVLEWGAIAFSNRKPYSTRKTILKILHSTFKTLKLWMHPVLLYWVCPPSWSCKLISW